MAIQATARPPASVTSGSIKERHSRLRAPFSLRCGAILIDYIVLISILAISTVVARMLGGGARTAGSSSETVGIFMMFVVAFLNLGVFAGLKGLTIGKWATGLRIQRPGEAEIGIGRALLRHFVGYPLSLFTGGLGFLLAAVNSRGLTLHDLIAGTVVVRDVPRHLQRQW